MYVPGPTLSSNINLLLLWSVIKAKRPDTTLQHADKDSANTVQSWTESLTSMAMAAKWSKWGRKAVNWPGSPVRCKAMTSSWTDWTKLWGVCNLSMIDCMWDLWTGSPYNSEDHWSGAIRSPASVAIWTILKKQRCKFINFLIWPLFRLGQNLLQKWGCYFFW